MSNRGRLHALLAIALLLVPSYAAPAGRRNAPRLVGTTVGGGLPLEPPAEHPSEVQRLLIEEAIAANLRSLETRGMVPEAAAARPALGWPLMPVNGLSDSGYHTAYHFVDLDPDFPGQVLDYSCGDRTYDNVLGYNHQGVDFVPWPFRWSRFRDGQIAVVAAAPGIIVHKESGNPDYDCTQEWTLWNAVYVLHADGSVAWYGHLRNGSLTAKDVGEPVSQGEYLGLVGASGVSTGPHLHFELHDANGDVVEPNEGPCNSGASWWAVQRPYYDSAINKLSTGTAPPIPFASCPGVEASHEAAAFAPGSTIYFTAYYRDQIGIAQDPQGETQFGIYDPDGRLVLAWSHGSPADYLSGSYWSFQVIFPFNAGSGIYRWEAIYRGVAYQHEFTIDGRPRLRAPRKPRP